MDKARKKLFIKKNNVQMIPPTRAALEQHVKRAVYQGCHVWGQTLLCNPQLPVPTDWGWNKVDDGGYEPYWTTLPEAAKICQELVSCKCKKGCVRQCSCKKAALQCTALCLCEGDCIEHWSTRSSCWTFNCRNRSNWFIYIYIHISINQSMRIQHPVTHPNEKSRTRNRKQFRSIEHTCTFYMD